METLEPLNIPPLTRVEALAYMCEYARSLYGNDPKFRMERLDVNRETWPDKEGPIPTEVCGVPVSAILGYPQCPVLQLQTKHNKWGLNEHQALKAYQIEARDEALAKFVETNALQYCSHNLYFKVDTVKATTYLYDLTAQYTQISTAFLTELNGVYAKHDLENAIELWSTIVDAGREPYDGY